MSGGRRINNSGLAMYHLRRIGPSATRSGVVNIMDFYQVTSIIGRNNLIVDFYLDSKDHIHSAYISRQHARVVQQPDNQHKLYDDSLNGVFINNVKISGSAVLQEGDLVTFGHMAGSKIATGTRVRQPDSEYQFIFERCQCPMPVAENKMAVSPKGKSAALKKQQRNATRVITPEEVKKMKLKVSPTVDHFPLAETETSAACSVSMPQETNDLLSPHTYSQSQNTTETETVTPSSVTEVPHTTSLGGVVNSEISINVLSNHTSRHLEANDNFVTDGTEILVKHTEHNNTESKELSLPHSEQCSMINREIPVPHTEQCDIDSREIPVSHTEQCDTDSREISVPHTEQCDIDRREIVVPHTEQCDIDRWEIVVPHTEQCDIDSREISVLHTEQCDTDSREISVPHTEQCDIDRREIVVPHTEQCDIDMREISVPHTEQCDTDSREVPVPQTEQCDIDSREISVPHTEQIGTDSREISVSHTEQCDTYSTEISIPHTEQCDTHCREVSVPLTEQCDTDSREVSVSHTEQCVTDSTEISVPHTEQCDIDRREIFIPHTEQCEIDSKELSVPHTEQCDTDRREIVVPHTVQCDTDSREISVPDTEQCDIDSREISVQHTVQCDTVRREISVPHTEQCDIDRREISVPHTVQCDTDSREISVPHTEQCDIDSREDQEQSEKLEMTKKTNKQQAVSLLPDELCGVSSVVFKTAITSPNSVIYTVGKDLGTSDIVVEKDVCITKMTTKIKMENEMHQCENERYPCENELDLCENEMYQYGNEVIHYENKTDLRKNEQGQCKNEFKEYENEQNQYENEPDQCDIEENRCEKAEDQYESKDNQFGNKYDQYEKEEDHYETVVNVCENEQLQYENEHYQIENGLDQFRNEPGQHGNALNQYENELDQCKNGQNQCENNLERSENEMISLDGQCTSSDITYSGTSDKEKEGITLSIAEEEKCYYMNADSHVDKKCLVNESFSIYGDISSMQEDSDISVTEELPNNLDLEPKVELKNIYQTESPACKSGIVKTCGISNQTLTFVKSDLAKNNEALDTTNSFLCTSISHGVKETFCLNDTKDSKDLNKSSAAENEVQESSSVQSAFSEQTYLDDSPNIFEKTREVLSSSIDYDKLGADVDETRISTELAFIHIEKHNINQKISKSEVHLGGEKKTVESKNGEDDRVWIKLQDDEEKIGEEKIGSNGEEIEDDVKKIKISRDPIRDGETNLDADQMEDEEKIKTHNEQKQDKKKEIDGGNEQKQDKKKEIDGGNEQKQDKKKEIDGGNEQKQDKKKEIDGGNEQIEEEKFDLVNGIENDEGNNENYEQIEEDKKFDTNGQRGKYEKIDSVDYQIENEEKIIDTNQKEDEKKIDIDEQRKNNEKTTNADNEHVEDGEEMIDFDDQIRDGEKKIGKGHEQEGDDEKKIDADDKQLEVEEKGINTDNGDIRKYGNENIINDRLEDYEEIDIEYHLTDNEENKQIEDNGKMNRLDNQFDEEKMDHIHEILLAPEENVHAVRNVQRFVDLNRKDGKCNDTFLTEEESQASVTIRTSFMLSDSIKYGIDNKADCEFSECLQDQVDSEEEVERKEMLKHFHSDEEFTESSLETDNISDKSEKLQHIDRQRNSFFEDVDLSDKALNVYTETSDLHTDAPSATPIDRCVEAIELSAEVTLSSGVGVNMPTEDTAGENSLAVGTDILTEATDLSARIQCHLDNKHEIDDSVERKKSSVNDMEAAHGRIVTVILAEEEQDDQDDESIILQMSTQIPSGQTHNNSDVLKKKGRINGDVNKSNEENIHDKRKDVASSGDFCNQVCSELVTGEQLDTLVHKSSLLQMSNNNTCEFKLHLLPREYTEGIIAEVSVRSDVVEGIMSEESVRSKDACGISSEDHVSTEDTEEMKLEEDLLYQWTVDPDMIQELASSEEVNSLSLSVDSMFQDVHKPSTVATEPTLGSEHSTENILVENMDSVGVPKEMVSTQDKVIEVRFSADTDCSEQSTTGFSSPERVEVVSENVNVNRKKRKLTDCYEGVCSNEMENEKSALERIHTERESNVIKKGKLSNKYSCNQFMLSNVTYNAENEKRFCELKKILANYFKARKYYEKMRVFSPSTIRKKLLRKLIMNYFGTSQNESLKQNVPENSFDMKNKRSVKNPTRDGKYLTLPSYLSQDGSETSKGILEKNCSMSNKQYIANSLSDDPESLEHNISQESESVDTNLSTSDDQTTHIQMCHDQITSGEADVEESEGQVIRRQADSVESDLDFKTELQTKDSSVSLKQFLTSFNIDHLLKNCQDEMARLNTDSMILKEGNITLVIGVPGDLISIKSPSHRKSFCDAETQVSDLEVDMELGWTITDETGIHQRMSFAQTKTSQIDIADVKVCEDMDQLKVYGHPVTKRSSRVESSDSVQSESVLGKLVPLSPDTKSHYQTSKEEEQVLAQNIFEDIDNVHKQIAESCTVSLLSDSPHTLFSHSSTDTTESFESRDCESGTGHYEETKTPEPLSTSLKTLLDPVLLYTELNKNTSENTPTHNENRKMPESDYSDDSLHNMSPQIDSSSGLEILSLSSSYEDDYIQFPSHRSQTVSKKKILFDNKSKDVSVDKARDKDIRGVDRSRIKTAVKKSGFLDKHDVKFRKKARKYNKTFQSKLNYPTYKQIGTKDAKVNTNQQKNARKKLKKKNSPPASEVKTKSRCLTKKKNMSDHTHSQNSMSLNHEIPNHDSTLLEELENVISTQDDVTEYDTEDTCNGTEDNLENINHTRQNSPSFSNDFVDGSVVEQKFTALQEYDVSDIPSDKRLQGTLKTFRKESNSSCKWNKIDACCLKKNPKPQKDVNSKEKKKGSCCRYNLITDGIPRSEGNKNAKCITEDFTVTNVECGDTVTNVECGDTVTNAECGDTVTNAESGGTNELLTEIPRRTDFDLDQDRIGERQPVKPSMNYNDNANVSFNLALRASQMTSKLPDFDYGESFLDHQEDNIKPNLYQLDLQKEIVITDSSDEDLPEVQFLHYESPVESTKQHKHAVKLELDLQAKGLSMFETKKLPREDRKKVKDESSSSTSYRLCKDRTIEITNKRKKAREKEVSIPQNMGEKKFKGKNKRKRPKFTKNNMEDNSESNDFVIITDEDSDSELEFRNKKCLSHENNKTIVTEERACKGEKKWASKGEMKKGNKLKETRYKRLYQNIRCNKDGKSKRKGKRASRCKMNVSNPRRRNSRDSSDDLHLIKSCDQSQAGNSLEDIFDSPCDDHQSNEADNWCEPSSDQDSDIQEENYRCSNSCWHKEKKEIDNCVSNTQPEEELNDVGLLTIQVLPSNSVHQAMSPVIPRQVTPADTNKLSKEQQIYQANEMRESLSSRQLSMKCQQISSSSNDKEGCESDTDTIDYSSLQESSEELINDLAGKNNSPLYNRNEETHDVLEGALTSEGKVVKINKSMKKVNDDSNNEVEIPEDQLSPHIDTSVDHEHLDDTDVLNLCAPPFSPLESSNNRFRRDITHSHQVQSLKHVPLFTASFDDSDEEFVSTEVNLSALISGIGDCPMEPTANADETCRRTGVEDRSADADETSRRTEDVEDRSVDADKTYWRTGVENRSLDADETSRRMEDVEDRSLDGDKTSRRTEDVEDRSMDTDKTYWRTGMDDRSLDADETFRRTEDVEDRSLDVDKIYWRTSVENLSLDADETFRRSKDVEDRSLDADETSRRTGVEDRSLDADETPRRTEDIEDRSLDADKYWRTEGVEDRSLDADETSQRTEDVEDRSVDADETSRRTGVEDRSLDADETPRRTEDIEDRSLDADKYWRTEGVEDRSVDADETSKRTEDVEDRSLDADKYWRTEDVEDRSLDADETSKRTEDVEDRSLDADETSRTEDFEDRSMDADETSRRTEDIEDSSVDADDAFKRTEDVYSDETLRRTEDVEDISLHENFETSCIGRKCKWICSDSSDQPQKDSGSPDMKSKAQRLLEKFRAKKRKRAEMQDQSPERTTSFELSQETPGNFPPTSQTNRKLMKEETHSENDSLELSMNKCREILRTLRMAFTANDKLYSSPRILHWIKNLDELEQKTSLLKTVVAVVGDTGAGKSSLMNALIDQLDVLPTSGMRACTAVVVEVLQNTTNHKFEADIVFLSSEEWHNELRILLRDLTDSDGNIKKGTPDPKSEAGVAFLKIKAVYGRIEKFEVLSRLTMVTRWLNKTKTISTTDPISFRNAIDRYIETDEPGIGGQYWPIVKQVRVRLPNCDVCSSGAVLVDLPGVRDSNAARDKIARDYLKKCTVVWVVSSIHRAIDDKTAKDLLGENFRRQLLMDGQYGSIAFICTKADIIKPTEIIRGLKLSEEVKSFEKTLHDLEVEQSALEEHIKDNEKCMKSMKKEGKKLHQELEELEEIITEMEDADHSSSEFSELQKETDSRRMAIKEYQTRLLQYDQEKGEAEKRCMKIEKEKTKTRRELSTFCAKKRNEYSKVEIKKDFKAGLREMKRKANVNHSGHDDEEDEDDLYNSDNDEEDIGSSADNLKVFCVSSTEYQKMKNLLTNDGPPSVFSTEEETQIPALRQYVHQMTSVRRRHGRDRLLLLLAQFIFDVKNYLMEDGTKSKSTRKNTKNAVQDCASRLMQKFEPVVLKLQSDLTSAFCTQMQPKIGEGVMAANNAANSTVAKWGAKYNKENKNQGGLHSSTYRATVHRQGVFTSPTFGLVNFNEDLSAPMYTCLSIVWDKVFSGILWKHMERCKVMLIHTLRTFVTEICQELFNLGVSHERTARMNQQILDSSTNKLTELINYLKEYVIEQQRDINRVLTPTVQERLIHVYANCAAESGVGMYSRMREKMSQGVEGSKLVMFDDASRKLLKDLDELQKNIMYYVRHTCEEICKMLQTSLEPFWEAPKNTKLLREILLKDVEASSTSVRNLLETANIRLPEVIMPQVTTAVTSTSVITGSNTLATQDQKPVVNTTAHQGIQQMITDSLVVPPQNVMFEQVQSSHMTNLVNRIKQEPSACLTTVSAAHVKSEWSKSEKGDRQISKEGYTINQKTSPMPVNLLYITDQHQQNIIPIRSGLSSATPLVSNATERKAKSTNMKTPAATVTSPVISSMESCVINRNAESILRPVMTCTPPVVNTTTINTTVPKCSTSAIRTNIGKSQLFRHDENTKLLSTQMPVKEMQENLTYCSQVNDSPVTKWAKSSRLSLSQRLKESSKLLGELVRSSSSIKREAEDEAISVLNKRPKLEDREILDLTLDSDED